MYRKCWQVFFKRHTLHSYRLQTGERTCSLVFDICEVDDIGFVFRQSKAPLWELSGALPRSRLHFRESCSVLTVNLVLPKYARKRNTAPMIGKYSRCVALYQCLQSVRNLEQLLISLTAIFGCYCRRRQPTCGPQASVPSVTLPVALGSARTGGDISSSFSDCKDWSSSSLSV